MKSIHPYSARLDRVKSEYLAAIKALSFVANYWHDLSVHQKIDHENLSLVDYRRARENVEPTYVMRLFGEYEGILKDHIVTNHHNLVFDEKAYKVDRLLRLIVRRESFSINFPLRQKLDHLRDYRNSIAHQSHRKVSSVTETAAILTQIVSRFDLPFAT